MAIGSMMAGLFEEKHHVQKCKRWATVWVKVKPDRLVLVMISDYGVISNKKASADHKETGQ
jgi:hypothetical protein